MQTNKNFIATIKKFFTNLTNLFKLKKTQENNSDFSPETETTPNPHEQNILPESQRDEPKPSQERYMRDNDRACIY